MISINDLVSPMNGLVAALLRSPLHGIASKGLMIVAWSGRRSGRRFSIPVGYQVFGDDIVVLISKREEKNWWRNFGSPWPAELLLRGRSRPVVGEVVEVGSPQFFDYCERTLKRLPWMASQFGGFRYDKAAGLDDAQRALLAANVGAVRFGAPESSEARPDGESS